MGQTITVTEKRGLRQDVARFELNRGITGMGHERYRSRDEAVGVRPVDELARRLFDRGGIDAVHIYSNVVTVDLAPGADTSGIPDIIRDLFLYYREGVTPPPLEGVAEA